MRVTSVFAVVMVAALAGCGDDTGSSGAGGSTSSTSGGPATGATSSAASSGGEEAGAGGGGGEASGTGGAGSGGDPAGGTGGDGAGGAASGCGVDDSRISVIVDGVPRESCTASITPGGLNQVAGRLDDDHLLLMNFSGQVPASDICGGMAMRLPGNDTTSNDWQIVNGRTGSCEITITAYGERVIGTFSGTIEPRTDETLEPKVLTDGSFDLACDGCAQ